MFGWFISAVRSNLPNLVSSRYDSFSSEGSHGSGSFGSSNVACYNDFICKFIESLKQTPNCYLSG